VFKARLWKAPLPWPWRRRSRKAPEKGRPGCGHSHLLYCFFELFHGGVDCANPPGVGGAPRFALWLDSVTPR